MNSAIRPSRGDFLRLADDYNVVPVWCELVADVVTPVAAFQRIGAAAPSFLFESAEQSDHVGRYSFLGTGRKLSISASGKTVVVRSSSKERVFEAETEPLAEVEKLMGAYRIAPQGSTPRFLGGAVGYLSFDAARWFEPAIPPPPPDDLGVPDMFFMLTDTVIAFDHRKRRMRVVVNAFIDDGDVEDVYRMACERLEEIVNQLSVPVAFPPLFADVGSPSAKEVRSNTTREKYHAMVERAKEYIRAGDIFQIVPSQRFETKFAGDAVELYRALRFVNPSPYMFCVRCPGGYALVGSSPEVHVRVTGALVEIRPIAGTRRRGETEAEDAALADELLADPKERAEHLMLVDLARNDVGRIARHGTVKVSDFMSIERYSHVMHIVSHVSGELDASRSAFDVMRATFPAGTVSGAPKVRAMQIINELENNKRCTYAGAVGYFGFDGNLDSCIALRTVLLKGGKAYVQAGGGVVADSTPEGEYQESKNKAMAAMRAIEQAERGAVR